MLDLFLNKWYNYYRKKGKEMMVLALLNEYGNDNTDNNDNNDNQKFF